MKQVSMQLHSIESEAIQIEEKFHQLMMTLPNLLDESVPTGRDELTIWLSENIKS